MRVARVFVVVALLGLVALTPGTAGASTPTLSRSTGLGYHDRVTMHAQKWAGSVWSVRQCWTRGGAAGCFISGSGVVPSSGVLDAPLAVARIFDTGDGHPLDCTIAGTTCVLQVSAAPTGAVLPISFDPAAPRPTIKVVPNTALGWRQPATVTGSGFLPNETIQVTECGAQNAPGQHDTSCDVVARFPQFVTDAAGRFSVTQDTHRWIPHTVDCIDPTIRCFMRASLPSQFSQAGPADAAVAFADDGQPVVILNDTQGYEQDGNVRLEVRLSVPSSRVVRVGYRTATAPPSGLYDLAGAGTDYVAKQSTLVFQPGETRHLITIVLLDDTRAERLEQFRIKLDTGAAHADSRDVPVYVVDDDA